MASSIDTQPQQSIGAACLPCRRRKTRCDRQKPVCGRCMSQGTLEDCEYAGVTETTRTRLLEENIALLEARIRELEHPEESAPSITLYHPHGHHAPSGAKTSTDITTLGYQPASMDGSNTTNTFLSTHEGSALIQTFLKYASQVGFFMNISRFLSAVSNGESSAGGIGDALVQAVYLWGSHLSVSDVSRARAPSFLSRSLQEVSKSVPSIVTETSDYRVVQTIQAEVLLSNYFFTTGRFLEGRYHSLAAVALVTGSRLHQLGSNMDPIMETTGNMESVPFGEKVCAFWTVYTLDNCWSVAMASPPSMPQNDGSGFKITTPWPLTMNAYEQGLFSTHFYTLQDFMNGLVFDPPSAHDPPLTLRVKATALYERATWLPSQSRADMPDLIYNAASHGLHHIIDHFTSQLAALGYGNSLEDARQLVVARTTACAASIQLHRHFTDNDPTSHQHCIVAANAAVAILDTVDALRLGFLDPIMAILWSTVGKVFLDEIAKLKQSADPHGRNELEMLTHSLDRIVVAMAAHTAASPLMGSQLNEIQQSRERLLVEPRPICCS